MFKIIKDKSLYKHLLFAVVTVLVLFFFWLKWLDIYTQHDNFIKVPDLTGVHITKLDSLLDSYKLRYEIIDSVSYDFKQKGVVVNQDPLQKTDVKKNRKIYLTINALRVKKVNFPDVFDLTLREAVKKIQKHGLVVGRLEYRPDIATNKVLAFKVNGIDIDIEQELYYGTIVDLVVGQGLSNEKVIIPNLIGLSRVEANIILKSTSLNVGLEYFEEDILDSSLGVIYKQYPQVDENKEINIGSSIDLFFELLDSDSL
jgi:beta-lactam-binding protein with PASTA domain